jgi:hypothetical protein
VRQQHAIARQRLLTPCRVTVAHTIQHGDWTHRSLILCS